MAEIKTLGPVGLNPLGDYNSEIEYEKLDVVLYQGSSYVALQTVQGQVPTNTEYWQKLVSGGVGVDDIVDNLDSNNGEKPLSAKQGNNLNKSKVEVFDTVALMKTANLKNGMVAETLGYYSVNDGGGATYKITNVESETEYQEELENGLYAILIIKDNVINIKQLGAKSEQDSNYQHIDIKTYLDKYEELVSNKDFLRLYIPSGIYTCSEKLFTTVGTDIYGDCEYFANNTNLKGTIITSLYNSQRYVWKFGGNADFVEDTTITVKRNIKLNNIIFSSGVFDANNTMPTSLNEITKSALYLDRICFCNMPNLTFNYIYGTALALSTAWEINFDKLNFRFIYNHSKPVLLFDKRITAPGVSSPNISACEFGNIMFEGCNGDYIKFDVDCAFDNNHINSINAECSFVNGYQDNGSIGTPANTELGTYTNFESLFSGGKCVQLSIDSILIQLIGAYKHTIGNHIYVRNKIFSHDEDDTTEVNTSFVYGSRFNVSINTLDYELNVIPITIVKQNCQVAFRNNIVINNLKSMSQKTEDVYPIFDVTQYPKITINNILPISQDSVNFDITRNYSYQPCYNYVISSYAFENLITDSDSINPLHLVAKKFSNNASTLVMRLRNFNHSKIKVRAKVPDGVTGQIYCAGATSKTVNFVGSGSYEWYEIDLSENTIDDTKNLDISTSSETLFDSLIFID